MGGRGRRRVRRSRRQAARRLLQLLVHSGDQGESLSSMPFHERAELTVSLSQILEPTRSLLEPSLDQRWLLSCQHPVYGGIAREPGAVPGTIDLPAPSNDVGLNPSFRLPLADVYHTYLSLAALSLGGAQSSEMRQLDPRWNVEVGVAERIKKRIGAGRPKEKAT